MEFEYKGSGLVVLLVLMLSALAFGDCVRSLNRDTKRLGCIESGKSTEECLQLFPR